MQKELIRTIFDTLTRIVKIHPYLCTVKPIKLLNYDGLFDFGRRCFGKGLGRRSNVDELRCNIYGGEPKSRRGGLVERAGYREGI